MTMRDDEFYDYDENQAAPSKKATGNGVAPAPTDLPLTDAELAALTDAGHDIAPAEASWSAGRCSGPGKPGAGATSFRWQGQDRGRDRRRRRMGGRCPVLLRDLEEVCRPQADAPVWRAPNRWLDQLPGRAITGISGSRMAADRQRATEPLGGSLPNRAQARQRQHARDVERAMVSHARYVRLSPGVWRESKRPPRPEPAREAQNAKRIPRANWCPASKSSVGSRLAGARRRRQIPRRCDVSRRSCG